MEFILQEDDHLCPIQAKCFIMNCFVWNTYTTPFVSMPILGCLKFSMSLFVWYLMEQKGPNHPEADVPQINNWEDYEANSSYRYIENIDYSFIHCNCTCVIKSCVH